MKLNFPAMLGCFWCLTLGFGAQLGAEWPERNLTLVSAVPETLPWSDEPTPEIKVLEALAPRLSRELGVPVILVKRSEGDGVLGANTVASAKPDGYLVGALCVNAAVTRVIQGYTPYVWDEIAPVATGWRVLTAVVTRDDLQADDLRGLAALAERGQVRLAHTGLEPVDTETVLATEAARLAGFTWTLTKVDRLDPALLLENKAEALVMPLSWLARHPQADRFKVLTVLTMEENLPCVEGYPTLRTLGLDVRVNPLLAFYLPAKVNWRVQSRLSTAINNSLRQPGILREISKACLKPYREDLEGAGAVMEREYKQQEAGLTDLGFMEAK